MIIATYINTYIKIAASSCRQEILTSIHALLKLRHWNWLLKTS